MKRLLPALASLLIALPIVAMPRLAAADEPPSLIVPLPENLSDSLIYQTKALHYSILRKGNRNVLFVFGGVAEGDSVRFRNALDVAKPVEEIVIYSNGGVLDEGLEIGRLIHARKLATHILRGTFCISSCNFMFMGGVVRYVDQGGSFQVHMFSDNSADKLRHDIVFPPSSYEQLLRRYPSIDADVMINAIMKAYPNFEFNGAKFREAKATVVKQNRVDPSDQTLVNLEALKRLVADFNQSHPDKPISDEAVIMSLVMSEDVKSVQMDSAQVAAEIARYLTEMGLSLKFLTRFAAIHNDQPVALTRDELREFNVINID